MRVAIDARKLRDFGIGTYIRNLLRELARTDRETDYVLFCRSEDLEMAGTLGPNFRPVVESSGHYSLAEQVRLPLAVRRERPDVYHAPHYVLPPLIKTPSVVTIHDCIHLLFPEYLPSRFASVYARTMMGIAARRSYRVLTVSEASKRDVLRFFDISSHKVEVVPNAIEEHFWQEPPEAELARVRAEYRLDGRFILFVGNLKPHKNVSRLVEAFARLRERGVDDVSLVVVGDDVSALPATQEAIRVHGLAGHVRSLGYVPDPTLAILYRLAAVFAFPSLYEGFGLPVAEAMACGTPVVASNVSSIPEVAADAALLVDPMDVDAIADGLARVLTDEDFAGALRLRGPARARRFSWERSVRRVRQIYGVVGDA
jgi:glycosyltransferase involved in cell wall biosynthesis